MALNRDDILSVDDGDIAKVSVPEWGGHVYVRTMTGTDRDRFDSAMIGLNGTVNMIGARARLVMMTVCDGKGELLFQLSDMKKLETKSAAALDRVFAIAQKINRISGEDVEELKKTSKIISTEHSGSASPRNSDTPSGAHNKKSTAQSSRSGSHISR